MAREATAEICLKPETKERLREDYKKDGETWDRAVRREVFGE